MPNKTDTKNAATAAPVKLDAKSGAEASRQLIDQLLSQKEPLLLPRFALSERKAAYEFFEENGCILFKDFLSPQLLGSIHHELGSLIGQQVSKNLDLSVDQLAPGNGFDRGLLEYAKARDDLRTRLYDSIQKLPSLVISAATTEFIPIVRDLGVCSPSIFFQFRMDLPYDKRFLILPHQEVNQIKSPNLRFIIVALVDTPVEVGALTVAPGSHKAGLIQPSMDEGMRYQYVDPAKYIDKYPLRQIPMKAGEALVLHKLLIHGSTENTSARTRWSMILRSEDFASMPYLDGSDAYLESSFEK